MITCLIEPTGREPDSIRLVTNVNGGLKYYEGISIYDLMAKVGSDAVSNLKAGSGYSFADYARLYVLIESELKAFEKK